MAKPIRRKSAVIFIPCDQNEDDHPSRTDSTPEGSDVMQCERNVPDRHIFSGPLLGDKMQKDQLMRFIQSKYEECLRHLDKPEQQKLYFFWLIMERFCNRNGKVMMSEIALLLFKGHGLLRRKLKHVENKEDWRLPLAKLLCLAAPEDKLREEIVKMGNDFASKGWAFGAHICFMVAQIELGSQQNFILIGCDSLPKNKSVLKEAIERTEVYEYVLALASGCGQPRFQDFKLFYAYELVDAGLSAKALDYCEVIAAEVLRFPQCPQFTFLKELIKLSEILLRGRNKKTEWLRRLRLLFNKSRGLAPLKFHPLKHREFNSRFIMGEMLGQGSFGSVFAGVRKADGKLVALKCAAKKPNEEYITISGETYSLPKEVALMKMVSMPSCCEHVVELLEWFDTPEFFILVMERLEPCMNLFDFCKRNNFCLPEPLVRKIMKQVVEASSHCCDRGVFHRDIKPENILINPDTLEIKLIDFGCGDLLKDEIYTRFAGTSAYWPPEWILHKKYHGVPATIWSLGILLFYLACGELPFGSEEEIVQRFLAFSPDLSAECCKLILWCLDHDPKYRPTFKLILDHEWFKKE